LQRLVVVGDNSLNIPAYFNRINYHGPLAPTAETLSALQVAHLLSVPFENLSIHAGEPIVLDDEALFDKIVVRQRGGFCYELNGLFAALLRAMGYEVAMLSAQVANETGGFGADFDHMALMVSLEKRWLVDVGFGDSFLKPLLLDERGEQVQGDRAYRIDYDGDYLVLMQRAEREVWNPHYRFTPNTYSFPDYEETCKYHQISPQSSFTRGRICSLATEEGRITLSGMRFITMVKGVREEWELGSEEEFEEVLRDRFGIVMKV
jgi:N-hydroxyarylamine O-acetyltransferase